MTELLGSYIPIAIFIGIALVIGLALLVAPFAVAYKAPDSEKLSAYDALSEGRRVAELFGASRVARGRPRADEG